MHDTFGAKAFGTLLAEFRIRAKKSQGELAELMDKSRGTINAWETGKSYPRTPQLVIELARHLKLSLEKKTDLLAAALFDDNHLPIFNVPFHRNHFFTGRDILLQHLRSVLTPGVIAALTQPQAMSGLGGIGKTQVALEYCYRYRNDYQAIFWLKAEKRSDLFSDYLNIASLLKLPQKHMQDQELMAEAVRKWLKDHKEWLLIFDNIEDISLIEEFIPPGHQGNILLTTRVAVTEPIAVANELKQMTEDEGILFLFRRVRLLGSTASYKKISKQDQAYAQAIWKIMDGLPLALDQAGAYILETDCGFAKYLGLYQQRQAELLNKRGNISMGGHPGSVIISFALTFDQVRKQSEAAIDLLRVYAFLSPDEIQEALITEGVFQFSPTLQHVINDPLLLDQMFTILRKFSLIHRYEATSTQSIHRLVQIVLKEDMSQEVQQEWAACAEKIVQNAFSNPREMRSDIFTSSKFPPSSIQ